MDLGKFLIKRVFSALFTLFVVATATFFLMHAVPGGPFLSERTKPEIAALVQAKYGLDKPLIEQYANYFGHMIRLDTTTALHFTDALALIASVSAAAMIVGMNKMKLSRQARKTMRLTTFACVILALAGAWNRLVFDLGPSYTRIGLSVMDIISEKFPTSARLGVVALCISVGLGIPMGCVAALNRGKIVDRALMFVATLGIAVPSFVVATVTLIIFAIQLGWVPTISKLAEPKQYILPAFALAFYSMSFITRLMRSSMLDVIGQDYVRTARAKGLSDFMVIFKHALRNSIQPVVTYLGPLTAGILTGGFVVEKIFTIPGLGSYFISSITNRDYPVIMGTTIFLAALVIMMNLIVDVLYGLIDPRIQMD